MHKKLLLSLLAVFVLACSAVQAQNPPVTCSNFCVQNMRYDSSAANTWQMDIQFQYSGTQAFINYPHVSAITSTNGDTLGVASLNLFGQISNTTAVYSVPMNALGQTFNPFTFVGNIHFTYDSVTCILPYPCVPAQTCSWTYSQSPGSSAVVFSLNSIYSSTSHTAYWSFGNGTSAQSAPMGVVTALYNAPGTYVACVNIVNNSSGATVCSYCDSVTIGFQTNNCFFTASSIPGTNTAWTFSGSPAYSTSTLQWSFGDGSSGTGTSPSHTYASPGAYTVCMSEINPNGVTVCSYCDSIYVSGTGCQANFTYGQQGNTFSFIPAVSGGPVSTYSWSFGNGTGSNLPSVTMTYNAPGMYLVCLTITTASGCVDSVCQMVTVPQTSNCQISIIPDSAQANNYFFQLNPASLLNTYTWSFGDGTTSNQPFPTHQYAASGTYTVCVTETNPNGAVVCSTCTVLTVGGGGVNCTYSASPIQGVAYGMTFTTPAVQAVNYNWDFGDGSGPVISSSNSVAHVFPAPGVYIVCLTLTQAGNTVCSYCDTVVVQSNFNCSFSWVPGNPANPNSFLFSAFGYNNVTYNWTWGDGTSTSTASGPSVVHTYTQPGTYQVCLTITANGAVVCTGCQTVTVGGGTPGCQANFVSVSVGLQAYFIDQSVLAPNTFTSYNWTFGDGNSSSLQFPNHQYSNPGWYGVCLTVLNGNCTSVYCDSILIDTGSVFPVNCNSFFVFTQTNPYNIIAVNLASGINLSFNWDFGDGTTSNQAYPSHQYASTGTYLLCLTVSDASGCSDTYCDTLSVDSAGNIVYRGATAGFFLNVLPPNQLTGTPDQAQLDAQVYPVPTTALLNIRLDRNPGPGSRCVLRSVDGRMVLDQALTDVQSLLDLSALQSGMYLLELIDAEGRRTTRPVLKQ